MYRLAIFFCLFLILFHRIQYPFVVLSAKPIRPKIFVESIAHDVVTSRSIYLLLSFVWLSDSNYVFQWRWNVTYNSTVLHTQPWYSKMNDVDLSQSNQPTQQLMTLTHRHKIHRMIESPCALDPANGLLFAIVRNTCRERESSDHSPVCDCWPMWTFVGSAQNDHICEIMMMIITLIIHLSLSLSSSAHSHTPSFVLGITFERPDWYGNFLLTPHGMPTFRWWKIIKARTDADETVKKRNVVYLIIPLRHIHLIEN